MEIKINLDDTYMNVIKFGSGAKNLAIIAGVSLTGLEGMGKALENSLGTFSDLFTVYVFDRKKILPPVYTIEQMADDIYACLRELGVDHTAIYGASQGGMIGQVMALKYPDMVDSLTICSSLSRMNPNIAKVGNLWIEKAKAHDVEGLNRLFLDYVYSESFVESIKDAIPALLKNGTPADCDRFVTLIEAVKGFDLYDKLEGIKCPVLVLGDTNDRVVGPQGSYEIADKLKCDIYMYDTYSHAVYDEAPDLKARVKEFAGRY